MHSPVLCAGRLNDQPQAGLRTIRGLVSDCLRNRVRKMLGNELFGARFAFGVWAEVRGFGYRARNEPPLESVSTALNQTRRLSFYVSMIFSENRFPLFGIML